MSLLDRINDMGKWLERHTLREEMMTAQAVSKGIDRIPVAGRINKFMDYWRGLFAILLFVMMATGLYLVRWYNDAAFWRSSYFLAVDDLCQQQPQNGTRFITSTHTRTVCFNYDEEMKKAMEMATPSYTPDWFKELMNESLYNRTMRMMYAVVINVTNTTTLNQTFHNCACFCNSTDVLPR
jgi:hypothetical protein